MIRSALKALACGLLMALPAAASDLCGNGAACEICDRSYEARTPPDWDGQTLLPVLLHFHGWGV